jgi:SHS2 domain-containing protein
MLDHDPAIEAWEHFHHGADIGIRGNGGNMLAAFAQAALALTAVVTQPGQVRPRVSSEIRCTGVDDELLFIEWINSLSCEMATRDMLFSRFELALDGPDLCATAWGERVDAGRHQPAAGPKGATLSELQVRQCRDGHWLAQCVVDM